MSYIGRQPADGQYRIVDSISGFVNNTRVTFPLTVTSDIITYTLDPVSAYSLLVTVNGALLEPITDFTVSSGNITFSDIRTPLTTQKVTIRSLAEPILIGVPSDNAVENGMFIEGSVDYNNFTEQAQSNIIADIITFGL